MSLWIRSALLLAALAVLGLPPHAAAGSKRSKPAASAVRVDLSTALKSSAVLIVDPATREVLFQKRADAVMPIASLTKLMTALVVVEARQDMTEQLSIGRADVDRLKYSSSRLRVGARLSRATMLHIALMSSENRAASALGRHYPGGTAQFVAAMNAKAHALGMTRTRFVEPTGLSSENVSTPADLAKLVVAAHKEPLIRKYSTDRAHTVRQNGRTIAYRNSNRLIANTRWAIHLQKTGYISEAGRCMVLHARVHGKAVVMVFLDAQGKFSRAADANRVRAWLATSRRQLGR
jgi:serine-type D-Ala-D-Ala endopeptidase (penicillin-binding protein 7)